MDPMMLAALAGMGGGKTKINNSLSQAFNQSTAVNPLISIQSAYPSNSGGAADASGYATADATAWDARNQPKSPWSFDFGSTPGPLPDNKLAKPPTYAAPDLMGILSDPMVLVAGAGLVYLMMKG